jgi:hypothetical protein
MTPVPRGTYAGSPSRISPPVSGRGTPAGASRLANGTGYGRAAIEACTELKTVLLPFTDEMM